MILTHYIIHTEDYCLTLMYLCVTFTADDIRLLLVRGCLPVRLHSAAPKGAAGPAPPPHPAMLWLQVRANTHIHPHTHSQTLSHTQTHKSKNIKLYLCEGLKGYSDRQQLIICMSTCLYKCVGSTLQLTTGNS